MIARYESADRDAVLSVWLAASRVGHPFLSEVDLATQQALVRDVYLPRAETWVLRRDGRVAGFIGLLDSFIGGLFVDPACHGQGVGRALVAHAHHLKGPLSVEVYAANTGATAFYRRCGFVEAGRRETDDEGRPQPLIRMELA